jgi:hypothetical protein
MNYHLNDLTIIIISRGRERILSKTLDFWDSNDIRTVVIHNSEIGIERKTEVEGSVYLTSTSSYAVRAGIAAAYIVTNFAIICSDDELYIPSALEKMILKLNENPEFTSVGGQSLAVSKYGAIITGTLCYKDMWQYENLYETALDRLEHHLDFSKNHIQYNSINPKVGGPKDIDQLFSIEEIKKDFQDFEIIELIETEVELSEGNFHIGLGSVIRFIGKKE